MKIVFCVLSKKNESDPDESSIQNVAVEQKFRVKMRILTKNTLNENLLNKQKEIAFKELMTKSEVNKYDYLSCFYARNTEIRKADSSSVKVDASVPIVANNFRVYNAFVDLTQKPRIIIVHNFEDSISTKKKIVVKNENEW